MMYSQCQQNHDDVHETSSSSSSSSTVTFCSCSIGYLVIIGCDHRQSIKHLFAFIDEDGVFTVT